MKFNHWIRHTLTGKITICILAVLLIATLFYSQIIQIFNNYPRIDITRIDTPVDFKNFLDQWVIFRSYYCTLLAYTQSQGKGTISSLTNAQCSLDMTKRLLQDVDAVMASYTENNPQ